MDEARKQEIMKAVFKAMLGEIVDQHILPTSSGLLTAELERISFRSGVSQEELGEFLKDHLSEAAMHVISREAAQVLVG